MSPQVRCSDYVYHAVESTAEALRHVLKVYESCMENGDEDASTHSYDLAMDLIQHASTECCSEWHTHIELNVSSAIPPATANFSCSSRTRPAVILPIHASASEVEGECRDQELTGDGKKRREEAHDQCHFPVVDEADEKAGEEGRKLLDEQRSFVADAFAHSLQITKHLMQHNQ